MLEEQSPTSARKAPTSGADLDERYRLLHLVGEGASSWVYAARDARLQRDVAVKLFKAAATPNAPRFLEEGRALAKLSHPHVVGIYDAGQSGCGWHYLVMELSRSGTLAEELAAHGESIPLETALQWLLPIMGAVACAHDLRVVHRDLKPQNLALVRESEGQVRLKLLDFGIATRPQGARSVDAIGTPAYMAPEQARGQSVGPAVDAWAMGVLLFRCLTGRLPFTGETPEEIIQNIVSIRAARIQAVLPGVPPRVALAIDRALEPDPCARYASMRDFARSLVTACVQDGVKLPAAPDPIGLFAFPQWTQQADLQDTAELPASLEPDAIAKCALPSRSEPPLRIEPAQPRVERAHRWLGAAVVAAVAIAGALWALHAGRLGGLPETIALEPMPTPESAEVNPSKGDAVRAERDEASAGALAILPADAPPPVKSTDEGAALRDEPLPIHGEHGSGRVVEPQAQRTSRPPKAATQSATPRTRSGETKAQPSSEPPAQGLVTSWDW